MQAAEAAKALSDSLLILGVADAVRKTKDSSIGEADAAPAGVMWDGKWPGRCQLSTYNRATAKNSAAVQTGTHLCCGMDGGVE
jgi:hypothetical protein